MLSAVVLVHPLATMLQLRHRCQIWTRPKSLCRVRLDSAPVISPVKALSFQRIYFVAYSALDIAAYIEQSDRIYVSSMSPMHSSMNPSWQLHKLLQQSQQWSKIQPLLRAQSRSQQWTYTRHWSKVPLTKDLTNLQVQPSLASGRSMAAADELLPPRAILRNLPRDIENISEVARGWSLTLKGRFLFLG